MSMQRRLSALALAVTAALEACLTSLRSLIPIEELTYRPERHYMRGPRQR
jgi:hypothetical protein